MAVVLSHYIPNFTNGDFVMMINVLLLIVGYIVLGKGFGGRTTYVSLLMSGLTWGLERIIPMNAPMTSQPLMELIFAVSLPAVGSAILFNLDASSGGTDIVAMILRKYTSLNIGRALMCSDPIITLDGVRRVRHGNRVVLHPRSGDKEPAGGHGAGEHQHA